MRSRRKRHGSSCLVSSCLVSTSAVIYAVLSLLPSTSVLAQTKTHEAVKISKPPLDTSTFGKWAWVEDGAAVSNDGKYVFYRVRDGYDFAKPATGFLRSIRGDWKLKLPEAGYAVFTEDSRRLVFMKSKDRLCRLTLGSSAITCSPDVRSFQLFRGQGKTEWLAYQLDTPERRLVLQNLRTGREQSYTGVVQYVVSGDGSAVVLKTESGRDPTTDQQSVRWVNLAAADSKSIWQGPVADHLIVDATGDQLAFTVSDNSEDPSDISIWHYRAGTAGANQLVTNQSPGIGNDLRLEGVVRFSGDGSRLFIRLKAKDARKPNADAVQVDVWSYADAQLQSQQLHDVDPHPTYAAVVHLNDRRIIRLQQRGERMGESSDDLVVMDETKGNEEEMNWSLASQPSYHVVSTRDAARKHIQLTIESVSPDSRYLIGRDARTRELCRYEIATGSIYNIAEAIPVPADVDEVSLRASKHIEFATWVAGDRPSLLVYDKFDVWQVDPTGQRAPTNLTNGYGRTNNLVLRLAQFGKTFSARAIAADEGLLLSAFNLTNKDAGFYRISLGMKRDPEQLGSMGPYDYNPSYLGNPPVKARDAEGYLVKRSSAAESPNYFWTTNFKDFLPISEVYPEKNYNWLTTELIHFKTSDGRTRQAVLYKPQNFDPQKKYPVILNYYEQLSERLNKYVALFDERRGDISISWLVTHGYVVVTPDIYYEMGKNGQSALDAILGVTNALSSLAWVDARHIGLFGQSFGGWETNYIVTHSNRFAAAVSSSGISNVISDYGELWGGFSKQGYYQNRQGRIPTTLWETPDLYIENSPIFLADRVTTPILTVANEQDGNVAFHQGLEWFSALRRLGKRAWMLQYDGEGHGLSGKAFIDFTLRSQQFFDHYLKGAPAPKWMTRGIPAERKGIDDGMELDGEIRTPGPGLVADPSVTSVPTPTS